MRRILVCALLVLGLLAGIASAFFSAPGSGTASATVGTLNEPTNVVATATPGSSTVGISWTASAGPLSPQGYYVLRDGSIAACGTSPSSLTALTSCNDTGVPNGTYTYTVVARFHSFTAASAASNQVTVSADNIAPTVTVEQKSGQADPTNTLPIRWTVTFSEPVTGLTPGELTRGGSSTGGTIGLTGSGATYEISLSGAPTEGTASFSIPAGAAQDGAGNNNVASTSADNTVTYDTTAPPVTLTAPANGASTNSATPALSGAAGNAAGDSATVTVRIYAGATATGSPVQTLTPTRSGATWSAIAATLAQGTYTAQATQTDAAGNTGTSSANTFTVDLTEPTVTVNQKAGQNDPTNALPILWTVTFSEPVTGFVAGDLTRGGTTTGGTVGVTGSGASYEISLSGSPTNGTTSFTLVAGVANDLAGNPSAASTSTDNVVTYDAAAPAVTLTTPANSAATGATPSLGGAAGNATGDSTTVTVKIYSGTGTGGSVVQTFTPTRVGASWSATASTLTDGTYTAQATQTDTAGNTGTSSANTFTVDATEPAVTVTAPANGASTTDNTPSLAGAAGNAAGDSTPVTVRIYNGTGTGGSVNQTLTPNRTGATWAATASTLADGTYTVQATQTDAVGNTGTSSANTFTVDKTGPVLVSATSGGGTAGLMEAGDTLVLTFNEPLDPLTVAGPFIVQERRQNMNNIRLTITGLINPADIHASYVGASNGSSGTSTNVTPVLSNGNKTVTLTLGTIATQGGGVTTGTGVVPVSPASGITDVLGNDAQTAVTASIARLF